jgi:hypothetical protein
MKKSSSNYRMKPPAGSRGGIEDMTMGDKKKKMGKGGGKMAPSFLAKGESKTGRPAKQKVLSKPGEQGKRMMDMSRKDWKI